MCSLWIKRSREIGKNFISLLSNHYCQCFHKVPYQVQDQSPACTAVFFTHTHNTQRYIKMKQISLTPFPLENEHYLSIAAWTHTGWCRLARDLKRERQCKVLFTHSILGSTLISPSLSSSLRNTMTEACRMGLFVRPSAVEGWQAQSSTLNTHLSSNLQFL